MPAKSKAQAKLMAMVAHDPKAAKRLNIPQSVGREFEVKGKGALKKLPAKVKAKSRPKGAK
jgi:hypothetical protein